MSILILAALMAQTPAVPSKAVEPQVKTDQKHVNDGQKAKLWKAAYEMTQAQRAAEAAKVKLDAITADINAYCGAPFTLDDKGEPDCPAPAAAKK